MSKFFINRPIFASVVSIVIVIAGLVASQVLPIAQYPQIAPPTVLITASYPGASAETLARTVAAPIEEQLNGVENLSYFTSSASANGSVTITATFEVGTNVDIASVNVNNRVKAAEPRLPEEVRRNGVIVQKRSNDILQVVALESDKEFDKAHKAYAAVTSGYSGSKAAADATARREALEKDGKLGFLKTCDTCKTLGYACPAHKKKKK